MASYASIACTTCAAYGPERRRGQVGDLFQHRRAGRFVTHHDLAFFVGEPARFGERMIRDRGLAQIVQQRVFPEPARHVQGVLLHPLRMSRGVRVFRLDRGDESVGHLPAGLDQVAGRGELRLDHHERHRHRRQHPQPEPQRQRT
ncbi:MAG: hypothetical protein SGJ13_17480, partial [Actinomycetota bacterium]|nr:hypothetical protein [Actinomycetota bacterium]